ncbi:MAG: hypothetical protein ABJB17_01545 [Burkholderiales bacterium]
MRRAQPIKPASPATCRLLIWLVAALLFGQSFGAIHRIVHAPGSHFALAQQSATQAGVGQAAGASPLVKWFGIHSASDCALIDHALQPTPSTAPVLLPAPVLLSASPPLAMEGIVPAGCRSSFDARGPPSLLL